MVDAERSRRSLSHFTRSSWRVIEPTTDYVHGRHIDLISEALESVATGSTRRLIVNIPPRFMKSILGLNFTAWCWATDPSRRFMCASYSQQLATRHNVITRNLVRSEWYQERFGDRFFLTGDQNEKTRFENSDTGYRLATSVGGSATGEGGDILVLDDPMKADEAPSDASRSYVNAWHDQTWSTRLNNPKKSGMVLIMQRLHEDDLTGHLLEQGGWDHLCLPARYELEHPYRSAKDWRTKEGELLWPDRQGKDELTRLERDLGSYGAAGQLQQRPAPSEGGMLKRHWWRRWETLPVNSRGQTLWDASLVSWDMAFKDTKGSSYVVAQVWARKGGDYYLLAQLRERMDFPRTQKAVVRMANDDQGVLEAFSIESSPTQLVEDKANGPAVMASLRGVVSGMIPVNPGASKEARAAAVSPLIEAGNVWLPARGEWVDGFINECATFPNAAHDDQVDAMSQALSRLRTSRVTQQAYNR